MAGSASRSAANLKRECEIRALVRLASREHDKKLNTGPAFADCLDRTGPEVLRWPYPPQVPRPRSGMFLTTGGKYSRAGVCLLGPSFREQLAAPARKGREEVTARAVLRRSVRVGSRRGGGVPGAQSFQPGE